MNNSSSKQLDESKISVLSRGLNYAVTPDSVPYVDYITTIESAFRNNKVNSATAIRTKVTACLSSAKLPASKLAKDEKKAIHNLAREKDIIVLPADKGRCTVVLDSSELRIMITR